MKLKKNIIIIFIIIVIASYFILNNSIGNKNSFVKKFTGVIPENTKEFLRKTIFVFKNQDLLNKKYEEKKDQLEDKDKQLIEISDRKEVHNFINENKAKEHNFGNTKLLVTKFTDRSFGYLGPRAYFEYYNKNLFLITGSAKLMFSPLKNIEQNKFSFKKIDTNLEDLIGREYLLGSRKRTNVRREFVKDLLITNDKIYISYVKKDNNNCFYNSILVSNLNFKKIIFKEFFNMNECQTTSSDSSGGRLSTYKDENILYTIGDYLSAEIYRKESPQDINSLLGKIIKINEVDKKYKIISMGNRNNQGLYYDEEEDIIYLTDHGPLGGDEINAITSLDDSEIKNFGWAISSYGEHYGFPDTINKEQYKVAPLNKSHKKFGFIEPIKYFTPAIAPTQIIENNIFIKNINKKTLYVGALGKHIENGAVSIHQLILNPDFSVHEHNIIPLEERVRDIIYIKEIDKIFLYLEGSLPYTFDGPIHNAQKYLAGSIAVLEKLN